MEEYRGSESPPLERSYRRRNSRSPRRVRHRGGGHRRSPSRHHRSSRKRHRSPMRHRSSSSSSNSSRSRNRSRSRDPSIDSSSGDSRGRSRSRRWRKWGSSRNGGAAAALLNSEPFSVRSGGGVLERPTTDWVCGVCNNPNSVKREDCYRCGTPFSVAVNATPSEEVKISGIPSGAAFSDIQQALIMQFAEHGDTCRIVAYSLLDGSRADAKGMRTAYVLFESVAEATKALTYARSILLVSENMCPMEFSLQRLAKRKPANVVNSGGSGGSGPSTTTTARTATAAVTLVKGLPNYLQPGVWKPVESFASDEEEKKYLDMLSRHWDKLSQEQKDYYDSGVRRALAAQRRRQQEQQQQQQESAVTAPITGEVKTSVSASNGPDATANASAPSSAVSAAESIARRLAEKKQATKAASVVAAPAGHVTPAVSLKERLAMKKAQLSSAAKAPAPQETDTAVSAHASPALALTSQKDAAVVTPLHLFFGFPIPSRFPTKTDYLTNTKSPSFRAGVIFRYVPPAVAERIVPPSARPPPA